MLGSSGMQLFVDAGISMNDQIVTELIREVVAEKIASLIGYPKKTRPAKQEVRIDYCSTQILLISKHLLKGHALLDISC